MHITSQVGARQAVHKGHDLLPDAGRPSFSVTNQARFPGFTEPSGNKSLF